MNHNNNIYQNQQIEQLERINQESRIMNEKLLIENIKKIEIMEKDKKKFDAKENEEMEKAKRQIINSGSIEKVMKIKLIDNVNKNKK